ncbi:hypothetical protein ACP3WZ_26480, partial [Salmonella enterica]|uniref:hypothetical protein n=1 Tax=Salmonella enterica TaxID=28901 RepID=UPI003CF1EE58
SEALLKVPNGGQYAVKSGHPENRQRGAIPCPMRLPPSLTNEQHGAKKIAGPLCEAGENFFRSAAGGCRVGAPLSAH